jgi:hypothetical protein
MKFFTGELTRARNGAPSKIRRHKPTGNVRPCV